MWRRSGNGQEIPHGRRDLQNNISAARHFNHTVFLKKKKRVKKEATGVLAMKETLFSDGRYEEPTVQYNRVGCFPQSVHADQCLHSPYYLLNKYSCLLTQKTNPVWTPTCLFVYKLKADVLFMASY